jgi:hypothetical protein
MILKGPGAQYRRGHSFGCVHKRADVSSWMRSRNHMLELSLTGFDPEQTYGCSCGNRVEALCWRSHPVHLQSVFFKSRHLQWAFSRRSWAAFLCLYFGLQALLFVKRTLSSSSLVGTAEMVPKGNAVAELARKVEITIDRAIYEAARIVIWFVVC